MCVNSLAHGLIFIENISTMRSKKLLLNVLKSEIWKCVVCKKYINMDGKFFNENLLLLLFRLLKFRKLRKSKCKKIFVVDHQSFGFEISLKKEKNLVNIITWFKRWKIIIENTFSGRYHIIALIITFVFIPFSDGINKMSHIRKKTCTF